MKAVIFGGIRKWGIALCVISTVVGQLSMPSSTVRAVSPEGLVIQAVQTGSEVDASDEMIAIKNVGMKDVILNNWTITYVSASGSTLRTLYNFKPVDAMTDIVLQPQKSLTLATASYAVAHPGAYIYGQFTAGMSATGGAVLLKDAKAVIMDKLGWGNATANFETAPAPAPASNSYLYRAGLDTDDNSKDFVSLYQFDVCKNIAGAQN